METPRIVPTPARPDRDFLAVLDAVIEAVPVERQALRTELELIRRSSAIVPAEMRWHMRTAKVTAVLIEHVDDMTSGWGERTMKIWRGDEI